MAKHIPERSCMACREKKEKGALIRVIRTPEGEVLLDATGRANGRGAYLCKSRACVEKAYKTRALERALKSAVPQELYECLLKECADD